MQIIVSLFLLVFLLALFILFTAIGLTFKLKVLSLADKIEVEGTFTVRWLLFSHTFFIKEPKAKEILFEESEKSKTEKISPKETGDWQAEEGIELSKKRVEDIQEAEKRMQAEKSRDIEDKKPGEKAIIIEDKGKIEFKEKTEGKEKTGIVGKIRGKKRVEKGGRLEPEESKKGLTTREILHWGLEAFKSLRKPLFRLFSDLLSGIKIKRLESCMTFGLSDPADTGILCGVIHSIAGFLYSRCRYCSFSINPVFMDPTLDFRGNAEIRVKIYSLIFPFLKFILNGKTLSFTYSIVKEILQQKWKSKWNPKWKSKWESKWKSKWKSNS